MEPLPHQPHHRLPPHDPHAEYRRPASQRGWVGGVVFTAFLLSVIALSIKAMVDAARYPDLLAMLVPP